MNKAYKIESVLFENGHMAIKVKGQKYVFNLKNISSRLYHATLAERKVFEISPSGYGIHWPLIDEDLSIPALLSSKGALSELQVA